MAKLKGEQIIKAQAMLTDHLHAHTEVLRRISADYDKLTPQQRVHADIIHEFGCSGHSINLIIDASYQKSESASMLRTVALEWDARILQRARYSFLLAKFPLRKFRGVFKSVHSKLYATPSVPNVIWCTMKLVAANGNLGEFYRNEQRKYEHAGSEEGLTTTAMPSERGSRPGYGVDSGAAVVDCRDSRSHRHRGERHGG